jgi:hypothetical protein
LAILLSSLSIAQGGGQKAVSLDDLYHLQKAKWKGIWDDALVNAGKTNSGFLASAYISPPRPASGKPILLVLSCRNIGGEPVNAWKTYWALPMILIKDQDGKFVELTQRGKEVWVSGFAMSGALPEEFRLKPGFASSCAISLDRYFELTRPGKYTVLANCRGPAIPKAATFELRSNEVPITDELPKQPSSELLSTDNYLQEQSLEKRWKLAMPAAGHSHNDLMLESVLSPTQSSAVNLVVSLVNTGVSGAVYNDFGKDFPSVYDPRISEHGATVVKGPIASDFQILVRDSAGVDVPLNKEGAKWVTKNRIDWYEPLRAGEAIGIVFPMRKLFDLIPGKVYTVLVAMPAKSRIGPVWVARPVEIKIKPHQNSSTTNHSTR